MLYIRPGDPANFAPESEGVTAFRGIINAFILVVPFWAAVIGGVLFFIKK